MPHELIAVGGRVKALTGNRIGGQLIRFTGPHDRDLQGEYFDRKTEFYALDGSRPILYHHGRTKAFGKGAIGLGMLSWTPEGIEIEADLTLKGNALKAIMGKVESGEMSWSSGSSSEHAVVSKTGRVEIWPIVEGTISPFTVDPKATVVALKAFTDHEALKAAEIEIPAMRHGKLSVLADALANTADRIRQVLGLTKPAEPSASDLAEYGYIGDLGWHLNELEASVQRAFPAQKAGRVVSDANRKRLTAVLDSISNAQTELNAFMDETDPDAEPLMLKAFTDLDDDLRLQIALATYGD